MNLVIDIGNTQTKAAVFSNGKLLAKKNFPSPLRISELKHFIVGKKEITATVLCSVVNQPKEIKDFLEKKFVFLEFTAKSRIPIKNLYKTKKTLGKDRLANAVGANRLFRNTDVLVIDAGTCIKFDFVSARNEYVGGAISPGIDMRFQALHRFTALLPRLKNSNPGDAKLIGQTTSESIFSGVKNGVLAEISGIISQYRKNARRLNVIFTGGDSDFFYGMVSEKNRIFAHPDLTLLGLNEILDFNNEKK